MHRAGRSSPGKEKKRCRCGVLNEHGTGVQQVVGANGYGKTKSEPRPSFICRLIDSTLPLVGKLVKYFRNVVVKHISVFHQRWGNGGSFEGFAAD